MITFSLMGCASIQRPVSTTELADQTTGYLSGQFSRTKGANFAFIVKSIDSGNNFVMPLGPDSPLPQSVTMHTVAIKLPPGQYKVTQWIAYATLTKDVLFRRDIDDVRLSQPFVIDIGTVTHLGRFSLTQARTMPYPLTRFDYFVEAQPTMQAGVYHSFKQTYPLLANQRFRCPSCLDSANETK